MKGVSKEGFLDPFIDFPKYSDWFLGEKAQKWRNKHEVDIVNNLKTLSLWQSEFPDKQPSEVKLEVMELRAKIEVLEGNKK